MEGSLSIKDHYVALAMITSKERRDKEKELKASDLNLTTYDTILEPKETILLENLFEREELKNASKKRLLIQGSAGIGKSTLCQKIAYQKAQKEKWLDEFLAVFWVKFRDLNSTKIPPRPKKGYTIYEVLAKLLGFELGQIEKLLEDKELRENCLLILDGYDELPNDPLDLKMPDKTNLSVLDAFQQAFSHLIVTTRPQVVSGFSLELEILGFENKAIGKYVENFFLPSREDPEEMFQKKEQRKKALENQLARSPPVFSLCHIPINLEIFCSLALTGETFSADQYLRISQIYDRLTDWLIKRFFLLKTPMQRVDALAPLPQEEEEVSRVIQALEELAWNGLNDNRSYFKNTDQDPEIARAFRAHNLKITDVTKIGPFNINNGEGWFIHLTFQEFFAAKYLARLFDKLEAKKPEIVEIIAEKKFHPRYQLVFSMTSWLLAKKKNKKLLQEFFKMLYDLPRDLGKSREVVLFAKYFEECGIHADIPGKLHEDSQVLLDQGIAKRGGNSISIDNQEVKSLHTISLADIRSQYEEFVRDAMGLLKDSSTFLETKFDLLNRNHLLLADSRIIKIIFDNLKNDQLNLSELLGMLAAEKNHIPEKTLPEKALASLIDLSANSNADGGMLGFPVQALWSSIYLIEGLPEKEQRKLLVWLVDPHIEDYARRAIGKCLGTIALAGEQLIKEMPESLIALLEDSQATYVREGAIFALWAIAKARGVLPEKALKKLVDLIVDPRAYEYVHEYAAKTLEVIIQAKGQLPENVQKNLVTLIKNTKICSNARRAAENALLTLIKAGEQISEDTQKDLVALLADSNTDVYAAHENAANILRAIAQTKWHLFESTQASLIGLLANADAYPLGRHGSAIILATNVRTGGRFSEKPLSNLIASLKNPIDDDDLREAAKYALKVIAEVEGKFPEETQEDLIALLVDSSADDDARGAAASILRALVLAGGQLPAKTQEDLTLLFIDPQTRSGVREAAGGALIAIALMQGHPPEKIQENLSGLLADSSDNDDIRQAIAYTLKKIVLEKKHLSAIIQIDKSPVKTPKAIIEIRAEGPLPEDELKRLLGLCKNLDKHIQKQAGMLLKMVIQERRISPYQMQTVSEMALSWILSKHFGREEKQMAAEILEEIVKTKMPFIKDIAIKLLTSINPKTFAEKPEYIEKFLFTFLKYFPIETRNEKSAIKSLCQRIAIAFYELKDRYYIAGTSEIYSCQRISILAGIFGN